ncbi:M28 family metallopeptidase [Sinimarinibacterium thermocellulolyticum]|uniref:M28 family metallopeptidase n=1 Tax=Sinimarinibacterium thermocellulolyticum TaxID=3170016 RepID=A0ABV2A8K9_9GAMM
MRTRTLLSASLASAMLIATGCKDTKPVASAEKASESAAVTPARISAERLMAHVRVLSSDEFAGRLPGTVGEEKTVAYLTEQFKAMGLVPGNPDGSYVQKVPLVGIDGDASLQLSVGGKTIEMQPGRDFTAVTQRIVPKVDVQDSELVFVGYGVIAPEYGWDDYKDVDVKGKTIVMLINDPAVPDPDDPSQLDPTMFRGKAMTYYGRWTYKYEIAARVGAAAALIIHETGPAGYPWAVVENSWTGEQFTLATSDQNMGKVPVQAWISNDKARELFASLGLDFSALKQAAVRKDFEPVPLKAKASFTIRNRVREVESHNVVAALPGTEKPDEWIVYSAHWDHLGTNPELDGDPIYNGALDNATGVAGVLEIARALKQSPPKRSTLFMLVTAEEQGLLGAKHYATNPLYPLEKTLAMINLDVLNPWGPTRDIQIIGYGQNTLEDVLAAVLAEQNRVVAPDEEPEKGFYYRSDQFEFAKVGVPALYADAGGDMIGHEPGHGLKKRLEYNANDYHKPSDEIKDDWNLDGAAQDLQALAEVGRRVANGDAWPQWKEGSEFKAVREASLKR